MPPPVPTRIGLALSGGGYRAAAFHLGAVEYLHAVGLGGAIRRLSTVSGGTIFGAAWMAALLRGQDFAAFAATFRRFLTQVDLVARGLQGLSGRAPQTPSGRHDLIVGMADIYASELVHAPHGGSYLLGHVFDGQLPLDEIVFNATEFRFGLAFRFQHSRNADVRIGNQRVVVPADAARSIRLADVVAASSCFPGGFEPMAFPHDFVWPHGRIPESIESTFSHAGKPAPIALMDGGINDNQGIESLMHADARARAQAGPLDLFVISDVSGELANLWQFPDEPVRRGWVKLWFVRWFLFTMAFACVASPLALVLLLVRIASQIGLQSTDVLLLTVPLLLTVGVGVGLWKVYTLVRDEGLTKVPKLGTRSWRLIKRISVSQLIGMLSLRIRSLLCLTSSVFMARIRRLGFERVYNDSEYAEARVSNLIYDLTAGRRWPSVLAALQVPEPSREIRELAAEATQMPTTLWFEKAADLSVIATVGRLTIGINLMKWIARRHGTDRERWLPPTRALWDRLLADWQRSVTLPRSELIAR